MFWFNSPSLFKQWQDVVLTKGFAFPPNEGDKLAGKPWQTVLTAAGGEMTYSKDGPFGISIDDILTPFKLTAMYCSMDWRPVFFIGAVMPEDAHGERAITDEQLNEKAAE